MKNLKFTAVLLLLSLSTLVMAQGQSQPPAASNAQAQPEKVPIGTIVENQLNVLERAFVGAAEAMPEDKFNFAPSSLNIPGSDYKGVRTFAQQVRHVASDNYLFFSAALGEKPAIDTSGESGPESITSKADIIKLLKDSFALGHRAAKALNDQNFQEVVPIGKGKSTRLFLNIFAVSHCYDHYGQMVEYLRMNGIIPPASRPRQ